MKNPKASINPFAYLRSEDGDLTPFSLFPQIRVCVHPDRGSYSGKFYVAGVSAPQLVKDETSVGYLTEEFDIAINLSHRAAKSICEEILRSLLSGCCIVGAHRDGDSCKVYSVYKPNDVPQVFAPETMRRNRTLEGIRAVERGAIKDFSNIEPPKYYSKITLRSLIMKWAEFNRKESFKFDFSFETDYYHAIEDYIEESKEYPVVTNFGTSFLLFEFPGVWEDGVQKLGEREVAYYPGGEFSIHKVGVPTTVIRHCSLEAIEKYLRTGETEGLHETHTMLKGLEHVQMSYPLLEYIRSSGDNPEVEKIGDTTFLKMVFKGNEEKKIRPRSVWFNFNSEEIFGMYEDKAGFASYLFLKDHVLYNFLLSGTLPSVYSPVEDNRENSPTKYLYDELRKNTAHLPSADESRKARHRAQASTFQRIYGKEGSDIPDILGGMDYILKDQKLRALELSTERDFFHTLLPIVAKHIDSTLEFPQVHIQTGEGKYEGRITGFRLYFKEDTLKKLPPREVYFNFPLLPRTSTPYDSCRYGAFNTLCEGPESLESYLQTGNGNPREKAEIPLLPGEIVLPHRRHSAFHDVFTQESSPGLSAILDHITRNPQDYPRVEYLEKNVARFYFSGRPTSYTGDTPFTFERRVEVRSLETIICRIDHDFQTELRSVEELYSYLETGLPYSRSVRSPFHRNEIIDTFAVDFLHNTLTPKAFDDRGMSIHLQLAVVVEYINWSRKLPLYSSVNIDGNVRGFKLEFLGIKDTSVGVRSLTFNIPENTGDYFRDVSVRLSDSQILSSNSILIENYLRTGHYPGITTPSES